MPNFQASLVNPSTNESSLVINSDCTTITITDYSNYDTNDDSNNSHQRADFTLFRKLIVLRPDNTEYIFSSLGDGDATLPTPSTSTDTFNYSSNGDGLYSFTLIAIPTYQADGAYSINDDIVFYNNKIYKCILNSTGNLPTNTTYFTEILESAVTSKYKTEQKCFPRCELNRCMQKSFHDASALVKKNICNDDYLANNSKFINAVKIDILRYVLMDEIQQSDFSGALDTHAYIKKLCNCGC